MMDISKIDGRFLPKIKPDRLIAGVDNSILVSINGVTQWSTATEFSNYWTKNNTTQTLSYENRVLIGTTTDNLVDKLQVDGSALIGSIRIHQTGGETNMFLTNGGANNTGTFNTTNGAYSLTSNTTGNNNTAFGGYSLNSNTTGSSNTTNGAFSLRFNTTGSFNTVSGHNALLSNTTGNSNTATGVSALRLNTTGNYNTAIGENALYSNTTGSNNIGLGFYSGFNISTGSFNVIVGSTTASRIATLSNWMLFADGAGNERFSVAPSGNMLLGTTTDNLVDKLQVNGSGIFGGIKIHQTGSASNLFIGHIVGLSSTGANNTAIGMEALVGNTSGNYHTVVGFGALRSNTTGTRNVAIGYNSQLYGQTASNNTTVGMHVMLGNATNRQTGSYNTGVGYEAIRSLEGAAANNTAFGALAMQLVTDQSYAIALGRNTMASNNKQYFNIAIGTSALQYGRTTSIGADVFNIGIGHSALQGSATEDNTHLFNVAIGAYSQQLIQTGRDNIAIGYYASRENISGNNNIALGSYALQQNLNTGNISIGHSVTRFGQHTASTYVGFAAGLGVNGSTNLNHSNTGVGYNTLYNINGATYNTAIGRNAGLLLVTGNQNLFLGYNSGSAVASGSHNVLIGGSTGSRINGLSNWMIFSDGLANERFAIDPTGNFGIGVPNPDAGLHLLRDSGLASIKLQRLTATANAGIGSLGFANSSGLYGASITSYYHTDSVSMDMRFRVGTPNANPYLVPEVMRLTSTGNFLVNTPIDNAVDKLQVNGSIYTTGVKSVNGNIDITNTTYPTNFKTLSFGATNIGASTGFKFSWRNDNSTPRIDSMIFDRNGQIFLLNNTIIGSTVDNLTDKLQVNGSVSVGIIRIHQTGSTESIFINNGSSSNTGNYNTSFGVGASNMNTTGEYNCSFGGYSLFDNTEGIRNVAIGFNALSYCTTGLQNTALGHDALINIISGASNIGIGFRSGSFLTSGSFNVVIGSNTASRIATLSNWMIFSDGSGNERFSVAPSGNMLLGTTTDNLLDKLQVVGTLNVSGAILTVPSAAATSLFLGQGMRNLSCTGSANSSFGAFSLSVNSTGTNNTAIGAYSLRYNTTGLNNVAVGLSASSVNVSGQNNTAVGVNALFSNLAGNYNVGIGRNAGYSVLGTQNTLIGYNAGFAITTGSNNVVIGGNTASRIAALSNWMIFSDGSGNERFTVDNTGKMGIGLVNPVEMLHLIGNIKLETSGSGVILKTPDGTKNYKITIDNAGVIQSTLV